MSILAAWQAVSRSHILEVRDNNGTKQQRERLTCVRQQILSADHEWASQVGTTANELEVLFSGQAGDPGWDFDGVEFVCVEDVTDYEVSTGNPWKVRRQTWEALMSWEDYVGPDD